MSARHMNLSWSFIQHCRRQYGFSDLVSNRIMHRITSVSYKVVVNGYQSATINPANGLRQGDALSPYLYILCAEALSSTLLKLSRRKPTYFPTISPGRTVFPFYNMRMTLCCSFEQVGSQQKRYTNYWKCMERRRASGQI